ncbi:MAG: glycine--tRNA ligase subunit beta [Deltaproteobacteria bacterium]|nr:glycine--tRNA ligase subunit beta [Deltaproteobacteria bacterium]
MNKELLLEIGTEEIPSAFLPKAIKDMDDIIRKELSHRRIQHGDIKTMATPRRLCLCVADLSSKQEDQLIEKIGPAKRVAFDENGNPTKAAAGFAAGQGIDASELEVVTTEKGEYICARKKIAGGDTRALLPEILTKFITSLPFKKSMRWSDLEIRFARPIHWILALYGDETIPFEIGNIMSGDRSYGHRFMSSKSFKVKNMKDYITNCKKHFVIVDPEERRKIILAEAEKTAKTVNGKIFYTEYLLEIVTYLVEYPTAVCGSFDSEYLKLPKEVLTTSMISHQKYFPVVDEKGNLLPYFITINNTLARDPSVVARGNEKVIRARLSDAKFFFDEDQKKPLDHHFEKLNQVVFHTQLGTSYEKVMQFRKLAQYITEQIDPSLKDTVDRTAVLAKADLETQMVYEFSELQGIMGREYALIAGEKPVVAKAIHEHYLPTSAGGELPETDEGAIVSIADKMDTIVGFFGVNLIPTGTADPYALRRQAIGIINIIINKQYPLNLETIIDKSLSILGDKLKRPHEEIKTDVLEFFKGRFENQLISMGRPYDVVDAVLETGASDIVRSVKIIEAMETFKSHADFEPLAIAFKRVGNIIKDFKNGTVDPSRFETDEERHLHNAFLRTNKNVVNYIKGDDYRSALIELAALRKPVDDFFNNVLVMAKDESIRFNRLSLLKEISKIFHMIADFSKIVTES